MNKKELKKFNESVKEELADVFGYIDKETGTIADRSSMNDVVVCSMMDQNNNSSIFRLGERLISSVINKFGKKIEKFEHEITEKEKRKFREQRKIKLLEALKIIDINLYEESIKKNLNLREIRKTIKNISTQIASDVLKRKNVRELLCPALKSVTDDVFDISKSVTPVLTGCVVSGVISIPLTPVIFAAVAVVIVRMSVASLCAGYIKR